jgi:transcriptional regulator with XRE-family HTH domain
VIDASNSAAHSAAQILRDARWMVGLTQAEVAQRAGVTQQTIASYERGRREPSVAKLNELLTGCGVRLGWRLIPEPGLEDEPTRYLLSKAPLDRLDPRQTEMLRSLAAANPGFPVLIGGKAAARLHGALVLVHEIELWVEEAVDLDELVTYLESVGAEDLTLFGHKLPLVATREALAEGWVLAGPRTDLHLRSVSRFADLYRRAVPLPPGPLPESQSTLRMTEPDDCTLWWGRRDLDHLALQRAVRLAEELGTDTQFGTDRQ